MAGKISNNSFSTNTKRSSARDYTRDDNIPSKRLFEETMKCEHNSISGTTTNVGVTSSGEGTTIESKLITITKSTTSEEESTSSFGTTNKSKTIKIRKRYSKSEGVIKVE